MEKHFLKLKLLNVTIVIVSLKLKMKMNKYQKAIKELTDFVHSELDGTRMLNEYIGYIETLKELVDKEKPKKSHKKQVKELLKGLGVVPNLKGYNYLLDGISLVKEDKLFYKNGKFMQLYKKIADIYNVTPKAVEKAMIHSVDKAFLEGNMDLFDEIFGVYSKGKISVSLFVFAIVEELEVEDERF